MASNIEPPTDENLTYDAFLTNKPNCTFSFKSVTEETVIKYIESIPTKSSCGYDEISTYIMKCIKYEIGQPLTVIINQAFQKGFQSFPDKLKIAKITPVFKKGNSELIDNYRPISLLSAFSKIFEKAIHEQLFEYFTKNKLFHSSQYGFRSEHSTELAALELIDRVMNIMNNNEIPIGIFIDLSKAFDTINHKILLSKLKFYGLDESALALMTSYLEER